MSAEGIERATAPARWLLDMGVEGIALTQTHALARTVVHEGAERWPQWWDAELLGPPHREADVRVLEELREGLRRLGLVRRRGRRLFATKRGCAAEPRWRSLLALTDAGAEVLATTRLGPISGAALVFEAELLTASGVSARLAVGEEQHLTVLHDAIQEAFGWLDDHLYSFWLDGRFWGDADQEFTSPIEPDGRAATADVPIAELGIAPGAQLAYVFDFGDEWRVLLTLRERAETDGGAYPRVVGRVGRSPPQY